MVAVPERLEELVGEAQADEVLHHLLPQVVVDAVQVLLREELRQAHRQLWRVCGGGEGGGIAAVGRSVRVRWPIVRVNTQKRTVSQLS